MVWLTIRGGATNDEEMFGLLVDIAVPISESSLPMVQLYTS